MPDTVKAERARFLPHAIALFVDYWSVSLMLGVLGLALVGPTGGLIRISGFPFSKTVCEAVSPNASGLDLPSSFKPTNAERCTTSLGAHVFDRTMKLSEVTKNISENVTYTRSVDTAIDANGRAVDVLYLDSLEMVLLAAMLLLAEWRFGATPGKRLCRARVQSLGGGPITLVQSAKRTLLRFVLFLPLMPWLPPLFSFRSAASMLEHIYLIVAPVGVAVALWIVFAWNFVRAVDRGELPWHDRWAGTEAVWTGPPT